MRLVGITVILLLFWTDASMQHEKYEKGNIGCLAYSESYEYLCSMDIFLPNLIECDDDDTTLVHCRADKVWAQGIQRICEVTLEGEQICSVHFDVFSSVMYIVILVAVSLFVFCCMCCVIFGVWATHCFFKLETPFPSNLEKGIFGVKKKRSTHDI